jgi:hypothetical protein
MLEELDLNHFDAFRPNRPLYNPGKRPTESGAVIGRESVPEGAEIAAVSHLCVFIWQGLAWQTSGSTP